MDAVCVDAGFAMTGAASFALDRVDAMEFLEVYKGVVPEFAAMVDELRAAFVRDGGGAIGGRGIRRRERGRRGVEGGVRSGGSGDRAGPVAESVRAKFGFDKVRNAVHCTDLPEEASWRRTTSSRSYRRDARSPRKG